MSTKQDHKRWKKEFNEGCLKRDGNKCVFCGKTENLDVHHITDRHDMPNGGYHITNGITVCDDHHIECEKHHNNEPCDEQYLPRFLYQKIGSSYDDAFYNCENLK